jgi:hypothetical protein
MDPWLIVGTLVVLFVVAGLGASLLAARRRPHRAGDSRLARGMAVGMLFGATFGTIVWVSTGEFSLWVVFMGGGMVTGLALGSARSPTPR